MFVADWEHKSK